MTDKQEQRSGGEHTGEPVGYFNANSEGKWEQSDSNDGVPFFAATPQQRKPLTDDERRIIINDWQWQEGKPYHLCLSIEAKLKEKNGG